MGDRRPCDDWFSGKKLLGAVLSGETLVYSTLDCFSLDSFMMLAGRLREPTSSERMSLMENDLDLFGGLVKLVREGVSPASEWCGRKSVCPDVGDGL